MFGPDKDKMHPEDTRNMFIFFIAATLIYFTFDALVLTPQRAALKKVRAEQARLEKTGMALIDKTGEPVIRSRDEVLGDAKRLKIDNGQIYGSISLTGGRLDDVALRDYFETLEKKKNVVLLSPKDTEHPRYIDYGWVGADKTTSVPDSKTVWRVQGPETLRPDNSVTLVWENGGGLRFEREISVDKDFVFTVTQRVTNNSGKEVTLYPYGLISQTGIPDDYASTWLLHEGPMGYIGEELAEISYKDLRQGNSKTIRAAQGWIGMSEKYWLTSLVPDQKQNVKYRFHYSGNPESQKEKGRYQIDFTGEAVTLKSGQSGQSQSRIFTGAKKVLLLQEYQAQYNIPKFDLAVNFGWFWFMSKPFFYVLHFLGQYIGNMGFAIILLTVMIRSAVFPLTNTSYRSFAKMKKVSPQIAELRETYGDDKAKLQQELMEMYQREGVNPMAGCLPILLQIPIFFALYKVLFVTIEIRHAPFIGWIQDLSAPDPTTIFNLFGLIPWDPPGFLMVGIWPCIMLTAMILQKKLNPPPQDPLQRDMANYFPFIITYVMSKFASGLVIYWSFSAIIGVIQQMIIMKSLDVPIHLFGESEDERKLDEAITKGPAVHPLAEMVEDEVEEALFGEHDEPEKKISPPKPKKKKKKK